MRRYLFCSLFEIIIGCTFACARTPQSGHLVVTLTDKLTGEPISNATVTVKTLRTLCPNAGAHEGHYARTSAYSGLNGVAVVSFELLTSDFSWWVTAPKYWYAQGSHHESFEGTVVPSAYMNIDTNTVDGLAKYNELMDLYGRGKYVEFAGKFEPRSLTFTTNVMFRSVTLYPRLNPKPMYAYGEFANLSLPRKRTSLQTNGLEIVSFPVVDVDLKKCALLPPYGGKDDDLVGEVSDLRIFRYCVQTNGVRTFFGHLDFAPGCGAYIRKKTGDAAFPTTYGADTNVNYRTCFSYEYHFTSNQFVESKIILAEDEYMVLRTRTVINNLGEIEKCNYSKILGGMRIGRDLIFDSLIFNPRENDRNLEAEPTSNLATTRGDCRNP